MAVLTKPIEIRAKRIVSEVQFPEAGREEMDVKGGMGIDALQHVDEIVML